MRIHIYVVKDVSDDLWEDLLGSLPQVSIHEDVVEDHRNHVIVSSDCEEELQEVLEPYNKGYEKIIIT